MKDIIKKTYVMINISINIRYYYYVKYMLIKIIVLNMSSAPTTATECDDNNQDSLRKRHKVSFSTRNQGEESRSSSPSNIDPNLFRFFPKKKTTGDDSIQRSCCTMTSSNIPSWRSAETFVNKNKCFQGPNTECINCMQLMFSSRLRGKPIVDVEWFKDRFTDHVTSPRYKNVYSQIAYKYFFMLRRHELSLREISRKDVLNALVLRFRGYYDPQKQDVLDDIIHKHHFSSIKNWCLWKQDLDRRFLMDYHSIQNNVLYCSGCGDKCTTFQSKNNLINYQKCSNNLCEFFHKEGSLFATVKKDPSL